MTSSSSSSRGYHSSVGAPPPLPTLPGSPMTPGKVSDSFFPPRGKERDTADGSPRRPEEEAPLPSLPPTAAGDAERERQRDDTPDSFVPPPSRISQSESQYSTATYSNSTHTSYTQGRTLPPRPPGSAYAGTDPYASALSFGSSGGGGVGDTPVVPHNSTSTSGSGANTWKRGSRKLSLTASMLGFGKKDRDRERKEAPPPSAYAR